MVDFKDLMQPPQVPSDAVRQGAEAAAEAQREAIAPDFQHAVSDAIDQEWAGAWALGAAGAPEFDIDPSFSPTLEEFEAATKDIPEEFHDEFYDAHSAAHMADIRMQLLEDIEQNNRLDALGWGGVGLRLGAAISDPVAWGVTLATEGAAAPFVWVPKAARLGRIVRGGLVGAASVGAVEGYIASQSPTRDWKDALYATAAGSVLGGAVGAIGRTGYTAAVDEAISNRATSLMKGIQVQELAEAGAQLTEKGGKQFSDAAAGGTRFELTDAGEARIIPRDEATDTSAGAQQAGIVDLAAPIEDIVENLGDVPKSAFAAGRFDMVGQLGASENDLRRALASQLAEEGVGFADDSVVPISASERATRQHRLAATNFYREAYPAFRDWAKESGLSWHQRFRGRDDFFEAVTRQVRTPSADANPHVAKVAKRLRELHSDFLQRAKAAGVRGFDEVVEDPNYIMRVHNHRRIHTLIDRHGRSEIVRLISQAMVNHGRNASLADDEITAIASSYLSNVLKRGYGRDVHFNNLFSKDRIGALRAMLRDSGVDETVAEGIASKLSTAASDGRMARSKSRLDLDEGASIRSIDKETGKEVDLRFDDLLENNAEVLFHTYSRQLSGHTAMAEAGFETEGKLMAYLERSRELDMDRGIDPKVADVEIDKLLTIYRSVTGQPLGKRTTTAEVLRTVRDYNFIRVMNQVGFAQIPEVGQIVGQMGWKATLQHVPVLRNIWSRARDGKLSDEFLDELETVLGFGTDRLRHGVMNRFDDFGSGELTRFGKIDRALEYGKRFTADISFMAPVNMALQRLAVSAAVQKFANMAAKGQVTDIRRLKTLGLDEAMVGRILDQMRNHVRGEAGTLTGRRVKKLNMDDWEDEEAAVAFLQAIDRWGRRVIQENDIGAMSQWMTTDLGKTLIQFRTFMMVAWSKQTLHSLHMRDRAAVLAFLWSTVFAGLAYTAQQYANSVGRDDADEYLKRRLSPPELAKAAFQRTAASSLLPGLIDTGAWFAGLDPVFAYGRTTGLGTDFLSGTPTVDLANRAQAGVRGIVGATLNPSYDFSEKDARNIAATLAFQNALMLKNGVSVLINEAGLPNTSR